MKQYPKFNRLMCVFCWFCTATVALLVLYMLHMAKNYPEIEVFARNTRIAAGMLLIWLSGSVWFTVQAHKDKKR